jgi:hypothetical protein
VKSEFPKGVMQAFCCLVSQNWDSQRVNVELGWGPNLSHGDPFVSLKTKPVAGPDQVRAKLADNDGRALTVRSAFTQFIRWGKRHDVCE